MKNTRFKLLTTSLLLLYFSVSYSQSPGTISYVTDQDAPENFRLESKGMAVAVLTGQEEWPGVLRAVKSMISDVHSVTGATPVLIRELSGQQNVVIIGTLGKNAWIDRLVYEGKLDVKSIAGKWEAHLTETVKDPFPGIQSALIIAGSDKRRTIYGVYDLSAQIGVSPWYWWGDVPVKKRSEIYVRPGRYSDGEPAVKYRGIFINDEAPAFSGWARARFGGVNHQVYEKVFELILRLKGNYLWPAMWGNAFNDDDIENSVLADEYGIVMGTSHHEPMDRAQQEWKRYGHGQWNYEENKNELQDFWKTGIANMGTKETIVTVGMRGDGDKPMSGASNIKLLESIVKDQRKIIKDVLKKEPEEVPQVWALYKEVQDYYDKGMRVPDDITLLLCDDNWGNLRRLPTLNEKPRKGGYGIYYHFDYVGGPRNYKWLNTNSIPKIWEQMDLAYAYKARQLWVVNVGDLKPMEYPISFFLDYAWDPDRWPANLLPEYATQWAKQQFGDTYAKEIARILTLYGQYAARRKPELLDQHTFSLANYNEFARVVGDYHKLRTDAEKIYDTINPAYRDAFYELVLHPIAACANLNEMYFETAKNNFYAQSGNPMAANAAAQKVRSLFQNDNKISTYYNKTLAGGKWDHMMDQVHIGYTSWNDPKSDRIPAVVEMDTAIATNKAIPPADNVITGHDDWQGAIAIEAEHYSRAVNGSQISWTVIPGYASTFSGITPLPVTAERVDIGPNSPHLEYDIDLKTSGDILVTSYISPTLDFRNKDGLFYAISIDNEKPQKVDITTIVDSREWSTAVQNNIRKLLTRHRVSKPGRHTLKYWMVDPAVVLQKIVIDDGGLKPSYLGPPANRE